jgi:CheY-like chemotaxis protein
MPAQKKVLLVDDELDAVAAMALLLELEGYDVQFAGSGAEALELTRTFTPDVALIDENMPQMSGLELARALRANHELRGMKLIAASGFGRDADVERARNAGFDLHLTKPVAMDDIVRAIEGK